MARPSFTVQYLIFCTSVEYPDARRPFRDSTLNGVDFVFGVPPNTEFPVEPEEFWLFARLYSTSDQTGDTRQLSIRCLWLDDLSGQGVEVWRRKLPAVTFRQPRAILDRAWAFRNVEGGIPFRFPGPGRYLFQLRYRIREWPRFRVVAQEYISIEVQP